MAASNSGGPKASTPARRPNRTADRAILVRCTSEQKEAIERAAAKLVDGVPGAKLPVATFLLELGLQKARDLGVAVPTLGQLVGAVYDEARRDAKRVKK